MLAKAAICCLALGLSGCGGAARETHASSKPPLALEPSPAASAPGEAWAEFSDAPIDCEGDLELRARVPGLMAEGKLDRARRVIELANRRCRDHAPRTWKDELEVLIALGRRADARRLAAIVLVEPAADAAARHLAGRSQAWLAAPPVDPERELEGGLAALQRGNAAEAQRLLDRARAALERHAGVRARVVVDRPAERFARAAFALGSDRVALADSDGRLRVIELGRAPRGGWLPGLEKAPQPRLGWSPDGRVLVASANRSTMIHDLTNGTVTSRPESAWVSWLAVRDGRTYVAVETNNASAWARAHDTRAAKRAPSVPLDCYWEPVALLDSGRLLACRAADGITKRPGIVLYDLATRKAVRFLDTPARWSPRFLKPFERRGVIAAGDFGAIRVFDLKSGSERGRFTGYSGFVQDAASHPGRDLLVLGGGTREGMLGLYDVGKLLDGAAAEAAKKERPSLEGPGILAVGFSAQAERIVAVAEDGVISEHGLDLAELVRIVPIADDFAVVAAGGEVQIDPGSRAGVRCQIGQRGFPLELCAERWLVPDLLAAVRAARPYDP